MNIKTLKISLALAGFFFLSMATAHADEERDGKTPQELTDYYASLGYGHKVGTMTLTGTVTFYGHVDSIALAISGGQANFDLSYSSGSLLLDGNIKTYSNSFSVPTSSPTFVRVRDLTAGSTVYYDLGGYDDRRR